MLNLLLNLIIKPTYAADFGGECAVDDVPTITGIECVIKNLLTPAPALIALIAVFMIIMAGVKFITAGSDPKAYSSAMNTFVWAIIGVILLSAAWLAIVFVEKLTSAPVTQFGIPSP